MDGLDRPIDGFTGRTGLDRPSSYPWIDRTVSGWAQTTLNTTWSGYGAWLQLHSGFRWGLHPMMQWIAARSWFQLRLVRNGLHPMMLVSGLGFITNPVWIIACALSWVRHPLLQGLVEILPNILKKVTCIIEIISNEIKWWKDKTVNAQKNIHFLVCSLVVCKLFALWCHLSLLLPAFHIFCFYWSRASRIYWLINCFHL